MTCRMSIRLKWVFVVDIEYGKLMIKVVILNQRTLEICSRSLYHYELLRSSFCFFVIIEIWINSHSSLVSLGCFVKCKLVLMGTVITVYALFCLETVILLIVAELIYGWMKLSFLGYWCYMWVVLWNIHGICVFDS